MRSLRSRQTCLRRQVLALLAFVVLAPNHDDVGWIGSPANIREVRDAVSGLLTIVLRGDRSPVPAETVWFNLALGQERDGFADAAVRSYGRALDACPEHHLANLNLALLHAESSDIDSLRRAEFLLSRAVKSNPHSPGALWNLGLVQASVGEEAKGLSNLEAAVAAVKDLGWSTRRLAMVLPLDGESLLRYERDLELEASAFQSFCATSAALAADESLRRLLPAALERVRALPLDTRWLTKWAMETAKEFGPSPRAASYGETLFPSWRTVVERPAVAAAAVSSPSSLSPAPRAVVLGSALGYQCLFFRAAGFECVGYDLLRGSMVQEAHLALNGSAPGIHFHVGDATTTPWGEAEECARTRILWLNDEVWPTEVKRVVLERAAAELPLGAIVVSYGPEEGAPPEGLNVVDAVAVPTSWAQQGEVIRILQRHGDPGHAT